MMLLVFLAGLVLVPLTGGLSILLSLLAGLGLWANNSSRASQQDSGDREEKRQLGIILRHRESELENLRGELPYVGRRRRLQLMEDIRQLEAEVLTIDRKLRG